MHKKPPAAHSGFFYYASQSRAFTLQLHSRETFIVSRNIASDIKCDYTSVFSLLAEETAIIDLAPHELDFFCILTTLFTKPIGSLSYYSSCHLKYNMAQVYCCQKFHNLLSSRVDLPVSPDIDSDNGN